MASVEISYLYVDLCTFTYQKDLKGEILVPENNTNNISELVFAGIFEIDTRNFFMTSDGKWNSNNPLGTRFNQVKPSCRLLPIQRLREEFSLFENNYSTIIANIRAIETLGNPRKPCDCHSIIINEPGQPSQIKLFHHLFSVRHQIPSSFIIHFKKRKRKPLLNLIIMVLFFILLNNPY